MKGSITVKDFKVKKLTPNVPAQYKHLLPTVLVQESCSFIISGCSNAVANAIRRTAACELKVAYLSCQYEDIVTTDPFIIPEMIQKRLRMIPVLQSVKPDAVFSLDVVNATTTPMDVKTGSLVSKGPRAFDETITILTLGAGHSLKINNVKIAHEYGYVPEYGMCCVAFNAVSTCKDVTPIDVYADRNAENAAAGVAGSVAGTVGTVGTAGTVGTIGTIGTVDATYVKGVRSQIADPRVWEIKFNTNGTLPSKDIVVLSCQEIISRLKTVLSLLYTIINNESKYTLSINGESDTIGNLLVKTIDELYPDVEAATYSVPSIERSVTIRILYGDDINTLYKNVVNHLVGIFEKIADSV
jgi:DNA-directed RNA polymerase subunit L